MKIGCLEKVMLIGQGSWTRGIISYKIRKNNQTPEVNLQKYINIEKVAKPLKRRAQPIDKIQAIESLYSPQRNIHL